MILLWYNSVVFCTKISFYSMSDLTPIFKQCVDIVQSELGNGIKSDFDSAHTRQRPKHYSIGDKFAKESVEFHKSIVELAKFIDQVKSPYLSMSDEPVAGSISLTTQEKNKIDEEFRFKVQQLFERLKFMQEYERKRQQVVATETSNNKSLFSKLFSTGADDNEFASDYELFLSTVGSHRTLILKSLNNNLNTVSKQFDLLQRKRTEREKQLHLLNFQDLGDDQGMLNLNDLDDDKFDDSQDLTEPQQQMSQQQIQLLEEENLQLLTMKQSQLKLVEKLHTSMVDIMNMQNELAFQLESQSDQINSLLDNHSQMEVDIQMGNKQLTSATKKNKRSANILVAMSLILAFLLLLVDYISF